MPSPFFRRRGEADEAFHARMLAGFEAYLDMYEHPNPIPNPSPNPDEVCTEYEYDSAQYVWPHVGEVGRRQP